MEPLNRKGMSLIEVLIVVGILAVMITAFMTMFANQQKESSALSQKLASLDLERVVTSTLADGEVCTSMLTHLYPPPAFDPSASPPTPHFPTITSIPAKGAGAATAVVVNTPSSPLSGSLYVNSISVGDATCAANGTTPPSFQCQANLTLLFDSSRLVRALQPLKFPITFNTAGATNSAQTISGCASGSGQPVALGSGHYQTTTSDVVANTGIHNAFCKSTTFTPGWAPSRIYVTGAPIYSPAAAMAPATQHAWTVFLYNLNAAAGTTMICWDDAHSDTITTLGAEQFTWVIWGI